ncbi:MAG: DNA-3-methyladenine glycosylase [Gammaproteobacteria bacterium]|nr:DNA-3-methyladenine glycosylase [Gammaproteobacteria bacterium]
MKILASHFFDTDACSVARSLLGKLILRKCSGIWLMAQIIETEAYYLSDKGSHASLGFTEKRKALFMPAGTIYMYYARGKDSLNISCQGEGNAVLIKSAYPYMESDLQTDDMIQLMQTLNPAASGARRPIHKLCRGQTLLCRSLDLKVTDWDQQNFSEQNFYFADQAYQPDKIIQTTRLGIPKGRDEHLPYRFIDYHYARYCSSNPLTKRGWIMGREYEIINGY